MDINRYVLRPKTKADAALLREKKGISAVVPLDDYLHITNLPFKMTPEVMLDAAFWAQSQSSYQEAEEAIFRARKLKINDDTVRQVTDYIGNTLLICWAPCFLGTSFFYLHPYVIKLMKYILNNGAGLLMH